MAKKIIYAQMMQRRDTAANWAASNPVLLEGELGLVLDQPNSYKVGDGSTPWNSLPLRGFDGNIVQELGDSATSVISQAGISGLIAEQNTKLAQLSQEWNEIKDAEFNISLNPHVEKIDMGATTAATIEPDKFYVFGAVSSLAIGLAPQTDAKYAAQYLFQFTCPTDAPTSLSVPMDLLWNEVPTFKAGRTYQISILENLALATAWQLPTEE